MAHAWWPVLRHTRNPSCAARRARAAAWRFLHGGCCQLGAGPTASPAETAVNATEARGQYEFAEIRGKGEGRGPVARRAGNRALGLATPAARLNPARVARTTIRTQGAASSLAELAQASPGVVSAAMGAVGPRGSAAGRGRDWAVERSAAVRRRLLGSSAWFSQSARCSRGCDDQSWPSLPASSRCWAWKLLCLTCSAASTNWQAAASECMEFCGNLLFWQGGKLLHFPP
jgi:hypothetical protein